VGLEFEKFVGTGEGVMQVYESRAFLPAQFLRGDPCLGDPASRTH